MFSFVDKCSLGISFGCKYDRSKLDLDDIGGQWMFSIATIGKLIRCTEKHGLTQTGIYT